MAFITSKGTMDKANGRMRNYLAERAELLGAVRLPNNAFAATSGDVKVTTDILFLKKRERPIVANREEWIHLGKTENGLPVNEYFIKHPEMVLGNLVTVKGQYGREDIACVDDGRNLKEALDSAVRRLGEQYRSSHALPERETEERERLPEPEITAEEQGEKPKCIIADRGKELLLYGD